MQFYGLVVRLFREVFMFFLGTIAEWVRQRNRQIFHYRDGNGWCRADPVDVGTRLEDLCPDYQALLHTIAEDPNKIMPGPLQQAAKDQRRAAVKELSKVARKVFDLGPLTKKGQGGVTDAEAIGIIARYFLFMEELARVASPFVTSPDVESSSRPASTTEPSAESGTGGK